MIELALEPEAEIPLVHTIEDDQGLIYNLTPEEFEQEIAHLESGTFETAAAASASDAVMAYIDAVKAWAEAYCAQKFAPEAPPQFNISFRTEAARQQFFDAMPGTYATFKDFDEYSEITGGSVFQPDASVDNPPWWAIRIWHLIIDEKPSYFGAHIIPAFPCEMLR